MTDQSRTQGWAICIGAAALAFLFIIGVLSGSYAALAIPVAVITLFALGLAGWVGYTIATIEVEPEPVSEPASATPIASSEAVTEPPSASPEAVTEPRAAAGDSSA